MHIVYRLRSEFLTKMMMMMMMMMTVTKIYTTITHSHRRFHFQLTHVHSALKLFGRCALQIYLLTYLQTEMKMNN